MDWLKKEWLFHSPAFIYSSQLWSLGSSTTNNKIKPKKPSRTKHYPKHSWRASTPFILKNILTGGLATVWKVIWTRIFEVFQEISTKLGSITQQWHRGLELLQKLSPLPEMQAGNMVTVRARAEEFVHFLPTPRMEQKNKVTWNMALGAGTDLGGRLCQPRLFPSSKKVTTSFSEHWNMCLCWTGWSAGLWPSQLCSEKQIKNDGITPGL